MAALAERQHGVVSVEQLRALGLAKGSIEHRVRRGRLHRVHRGVYAVGHPLLTWRGRLWAAVLACGGPGAAAISHRTAAAVWDLAPAPRKVDVVTRNQSRSTDAIRVHRTGDLPLADVVRQADGLPVTSVARTLADVARTTTTHRLERLCHRAMHLRILDVAQLPAGHPGAKRLRRALESLAASGPQVTRSELEERFLALIAAHRLPPPEVNARAAGYEVDFLWRAERLVAETDGAATHLTARAFEADRRRDEALQLAGLRVVRFTWRRVTEEPEAVAATLAALLGATDAPLRAAAGALSPPAPTRPR